MCTTKLKTNRPGSARFTRQAWIVYQWLLEMMVYWEWCTGYWWHLHTHTMGLLLILHLTCGSHTSLFFYTFFMPFLHLTVHFIQR
jgi:hypothetical protein